MTKQEFTDRTGFIPTDEHFQAIHDEYMAAGDNVDKDTFCDRWINENGKQTVYDWMTSRYEAARDELAAKKEDVRELGNRVADLSEMVDRKDTEIGLLHDRIKLLEARLTAHEVKEERMKKHYAEFTDEFLRYRRALLIARLMMESLRDCADGEDLTMVLDEIGAALAVGKTTGTNVNEE